MMKDYGYYYPNFDVKEGAKALRRAIETHDSCLEEYSHSAEKALYRFSTKNKKNIDGFKEIIKTLLSR